MKHIYDNQNGDQNHHKSSEERFTERFREVVQNYEPVFEPADWSAMQSKLAAHNEKDRKAVVFRRLAVFATMGAAAVILLFSMITPPSCNGLFLKKMDSSNAAEIAELNFSPEAV